jgi:sarcosine oxidase
MQHPYDAIVIGIGTMGSAACYYLSKNGARVLGIEQFNIPHDLGSHAGQSRIIRKAYAEHPDYVPLLERAYENWVHLEEISGQQVFYKTGLIYCGKPDNSWMQGVKRSSVKYNIPIQSLTHSVFTNQFPQFNIPSNYEILLEPDAGFITPEKAITLYAEHAVKLGAEIKANTTVRYWDKVSGVFQVYTSEGVFRSKKLIVTSGAWSGVLMPALSNVLTVTRQTVAWVYPDKPDGFAPGIFPCWIIADENKPGIFYGFPMLNKAQFDGPNGIKLAHHYPAEKTHPDTINRYVSKKDEEIIHYVLQKYFTRNTCRMQVMKVCMYTNTPDEHFILGTLPADEDVVIAAGFSGHGFKFASAIGEILCTIALQGKTEMPVHFLSASRFI